MFQNQELDDRQLRYFGASLAAMIAIFGGLAYWRWHVPWIGGGLAAVAAVVGGTYYGLPRSQRPIYRGFRWLTYPIQLVASAIILAIVYYLVLVPIGVMLRWCGKSIRRDTASGDQQESLWNERDDKPDASRYFDTF